MVGVDKIRIQVEGHAGLRVKLCARFHGLCVRFSIDVTKGDAITPSPEIFKLPSHFCGKTRYPLLAYTVETVLAEKCESILKRNVVGTRPRDYYDVYMLSRLRKVRPRVFKAAVRSTFEKCGTGQLLCSIPAILDGISRSPVQEEYWRRYQQEFPYARGLSFHDVVGSVRRLLKGI